MANLQPQFLQFLDAIAVKRDQEKKLLSEKRAKIESRLAEGLARQRAKGIEIPSYKLLNQGSYAMGTGNRPLDGDYDLDVALLFDLDHRKQPDPVAVKRWVLDALDGHTNDVRMREPCVTVTYQSAGEPIYHLDFAVYANANSDGKTYLARGKLQSAEANRRWEESDPKALIEIVAGKCSDPEDSKQFRRVIRYLKRWVAVQFPTEGNAAPRGIAITACALRWFAVDKATVNGKTLYDDHGALKSLVRMMLSQFHGAWEGTRLVSRLSVNLPVPPGNDLFERMTSQQMQEFKGRLEVLQQALEEAKRDVDPHSAAKVLQKEFGRDFPVPLKVETGTPRGRSIVGSGNSG